MKKKESQTRLTRCSTHRCSDAAAQQSCGERCFEATEIEKNRTVIELVITARLPYGSVSFPTRLLTRDSGLIVKIELMIRKSQGKGIFSPDPPTAYLHL